MRRPTNEVASCFLQQTIERSLKAFLLSRRWRLERIHDLGALLNAALPHSPALEEYRSVCQAISSFYFAERYPLLIPLGITECDIRRCMSEVAPMVDELWEMTGQGREA